MPANQAFLLVSAI